MSRFLAKAASLFSFLFLGLTASAQLDSNYVKTYESKLVFAINQSYRTQRLDILQTSVEDLGGRSNVAYSSSSRLMNGLSFDWEKLSLAFSWKTPTPVGQEKKQGESVSRNLGAAINAKRWRIEGAYRFYKGFFDSNISNIPNFSDSTPYYINDDLAISSLKIKAIYFRNKKKRFSYKAAYANTQRQLRSSLTFIWATNFYHQTISSDDNIIPSIVPQQFYIPYREIDRIRLTGVSMNPGFSGTIVLFKRFFFNATIAWGPQLEWRELAGRRGGDRRELKLSVNNGESRVSFGYNGDRLIFYSWTMNDFDNLRFNDLQMNRVMIQGGVTLGYRFAVKPNRLTTLIKENSLYKRL